MKLIISYMHFVEGIDSFEPEIDLKSHVEKWDFSGT